ncbi:MAG: ribonuclease III [Fervidobacterium sp.]|uniref:Ribonuclease 3 n=2 Tax=Fervidobacteriaceae TaxID=1643950 RepID=A0A7C4W464_FERPE|nr:ribonuclease III [Fervidobacterium sp.]
MDDLRERERRILGELQEKLGYHFKNPMLLYNALCHSSYAYEVNQLGRDVKNNERLEFLGDAVVELVVCDILYNKYPDATEGEMAKTKGAVASEEVLTEIASQYELGKYIFLGKGEEKTGGRTRSSIIADTFEAVCAAIYLDGGLTKVMEVFGEKFEKAIEVFLTGQRIFDYKTALQEITQEKYRELPEYRTVKQDENGRFVVELYLQGQKVSTGTGASKKDAEKDAAKKAYEILTATGESSSNSN